MSEFALYDNFNPDGIFGSEDEYEKRSRKKRRTALAPHLRLRRARTMTVIHSSSRYVDEMAPWTITATVTSSWCPRRTRLRHGRVWARKSYAVQKYLQTTVFKEEPAARVLLLSANIMYGTFLASDLVQQGMPKVVFYKKESDEELTKVTVVCSLESIHRLKVNGTMPAFDTVILDEVRTLAGLVGGSTMPNFHNLGPERVISPARHRGRRRPPVQVPRERAVSGDGDLPSPCHALAPHRLRSSATTPRRST